MTPLALKPEQMDEAAMLYEECGWTASDIAEHFGVSENAARSALRVRGIEMRAKGNTAPALRVKQCSRCLHFLPLAAFSGRDASREKLAAWCMDCANAGPAPKFNLNPAPLAQALAQWKTS